MDFEDTPEELAFRREARAWLEAAVPALWAMAGAPATWTTEVLQLAATKAWQAMKFDAGYASITGPPDLGGRSGRPIEAVIFRQEESRFRLPGSELAIGLGMCIPIVGAYGSDAHRSRYLRPGLRGDEVWSQLFSEPAAGSDVAAIRTRAVRDGDAWVVTGQKIWTSGAHFSDFGILLARTNPKAPKHRGLTMFILDFRAPGVTVRPVRQLSGQSDFNEVFIDEVRIPDSDRLGAIDDGWRVAISTLMHERHTAGGGLGFVDYHHILELARRRTFLAGPAIADGRIRERIADMYLNSRAGRLLNYKAQTALSKGVTPGPEQSVIKAVSAYQGQQASYLAMDLMGVEGALTPEELGPEWSRVERSWTWGAAMRIAGGSDEILRNIIAERVLGLPSDPRADKDIPFEDLPA